MIRLLLGTDLRRTDRSTHYSFAAAWRLVWLLCRRLPHSGQHRFRMVFWYWTLLLKDTDFENIFLEKQNSNKKLKTKPIELCFMCSILLIGFLVCLFLPFLFGLFLELFGGLTKRRLLLPKFHVKVSCFNGKQMLVVVIGSSMSPSKGL
jgi:hypothetical protein